MRTPEGKVCLLCFSTFRSLGLHFKHKSYAEYHKWLQASRENAQDHGRFLKAVQEWIRQHNANPGLVKVDVAALKRAKTVLDTEAKTGVKMKGPKRNFVLLDHWDEKLDGPLDENKIVEITWGGKVVKGIYKAAGREGVLEVEDFEEANLTERTRQHTGEGMFAEEALAVKKEALGKVFTDASDQRAKHTVAAGPAPMELSAVLGALRGLVPDTALAGVAETSGEGAPSAAEAPLPHWAPEEEDLPDSEQEEDALAALAASVGGRLGGRAKAKAKAKQLPTGSSAAKTKVARAPAASTAPGAPSAPAASNLQKQKLEARSRGEPAEAEAFVLDGRGLRLRENLQEAAQKLEESMQAHLALDVNLLSKDAKQIFTKQSKALASFLTGANKHIKRIEESPNRQGLLAELDRFQKARSAAGLLLDLLKQLYAANPSAQDLGEAVEACLAAPPMRIELGPGVWEALLEAKCTHFCLYRDFVGYSQLFRSSAKEARHLGRGGSWPQGSC